MEPKVLSPSQVAEFMESGYTILRQAFSPETAAACREFLWGRMGLKAGEPQGWGQAMVHIKECFPGGPFAGAFTERLASGMDDVMGEGRYHPVDALGWWPVLFPGFEVKQKGWHLDGIHFHHRVISPDQGLLPIFIFSDIGPGDGGTSLMPGSHKVGARVLAAAEPEGLEVNELCKRVRALCPGEGIEAEGRAGDVILIHPFMLHATSSNSGKSVRFACNPCYALKEPMNFSRPDGQCSPVERAIAAALKEDA